MTADDLMTIRSAFTKYCSYSGNDSKYVQIDLIDFPAFISRMREVYPNHLFWEYGYNATFCEDTVTIEWRDFVPSEISDEDFFYMMEWSFNHDLEAEQNIEVSRIKDIISSIKNYDTLDNLLEDIHKNTYIDLYIIRKMVGRAIYNNEKYYKIFREQYRDKYNEVSSDREKLEISFDILKNN